MHAVSSLIPAWSSRGAHPGPAWLVRWRTFWDPKIYWIPKTYWFPNNLRKSPSGIRNSQLLGHGAFVLLPTTHSLRQSTVHVQFIDVPYVSRMLHPGLLGLVIFCMIIAQPFVPSITIRPWFNPNVPCGDVMSLSGCPACTRLANMTSRTKDFRTTVTSEMDGHAGDGHISNSLYIVSQLN